MCLHRTKKSRFTLRHQPKQLPATISQYARIVTGIPAYPRRGAVPHQLLKTEMRAHFAGMRDPTDSGTKSLPGLDTVPHRPLTEPNYLVRALDPETEQGNRVDSQPQWRRRLLKTHPARRKQTQEQPACLSACLGTAVTW